MATDLDEALRIACPSDEAAFRRYHATTVSLRALPKAHLHIHAGAVLRNCDVKAALGHFNTDPARLREAHKNLEQKAQTDERARLQLPLLAGERLYLPPIFWEEDGSLKASGYEPAALDAACPWPGFTGWNEPANLWHGMGGCRDYSLVTRLIGIGVHGTQPPPDSAWVETFTKASEDARTEGIRWVEYCGLFGHCPTGEDLATTEAWQAWREPFLAAVACVTRAVPEVGIAFTLVPDMTDGAFAAAFVERWQLDIDMRSLIRGFGEVGAAEPAAHAASYAVYQQAGLRAVSVHAGEWCPERVAGVEESMGRLVSCLDLGVTRIGHGILAHTDAELMARLRTADCCLEVCPTSNRILDNVPGGLASHPLRVLYDAGVPVVLASDDPGHCGSPNGHGLVREYLVARDTLGFSAAELARLAKNSFAYSLAPETLKAAALEDIDRWLAEQAADSKLKR